MTQKAEVIKLRENEENQIKYNEYRESSEPGDRPAMDLPPTRSIHHTQPDRRRSDQRCKEERRNSSSNKKDQIFKHRKRRSSLLTSDFKLWAFYSTVHNFLVNFHNPIRHFFGGKNLFHSFSACFTHFLVALWTFSQLLDALS